MLLGSISYLFIAFNIINSVEGAQSVLTMVKGMLQKEGSISSIPQERDDAIPTSGIESMTFDESPSIPNDNIKDDGHFQSQSERPQHDDDDDQFELISCKDEKENHSKSAPPLPDDERLESLDDDYVIITTGEPKDPDTSTSKGIKDDPPVSLKH